MVRAVAVGRECSVGLASVLTDQCGVQSPLAGRGELCVDQSLGSHARSELAGQSGMLCQQKRTGEWDLADALGARLCVSVDHPDGPGTRRGIGELVWAPNLD